MLRTRNWQYALLLLAGIPAFVFAYLGHFSRLIVDDYCSFHAERTMDAWKGMLFYYETQSASWSRVALHSILSPFEVLAVALTPPAIVALSTIGLYWILRQAVARLLQGRPHRITLWIISLLISAAAINAFASPESFYWYNASTGYTLPAALFIIYLALLIALGGKDRPAVAQYLGLAASIVIAFGLGGASEMFAVFQFAFLAVAIIFIILFVKPSLRLRFLTLFFAGCLGNAASLLLHLSSPGMNARVEAIEAGPIARIRYLPDLLNSSQKFTLHYLVQQDAFAGFMLLFGLGLVATLLLYRPVTLAGQSQARSLRAAPLWLCLFVQLLFVPIMWTHTSDLPQFAGRFSYAFATVLVVNLLSLLVIVAMLLWRRRFEQEILIRPNGLPLYLTSILLIVTVLFAMTQLRSIDIRAAAYLFFTSLTFIGALGWQLAPLTADRRATRFALLATVSYVMPIAATAALVAVSLYGRGSVTERILAPIAYLQVIPGLIWGAYFAFLIQRLRLRSGASKRWIPVSGAIGIVLLASVATGIVFGHAKLIPDFSVFAREWDARHEQLLQARENGVQDVEVEPLAYDLSYFLLGKDMSDHVERNCAQIYYDIDNISVVGS